MSFSQKKYQLFLTLILFVLCLSINVQASSKYFGIGIELRTEDREYPVIANVFPNTPASRAGLQKQDKLWAIDGYDLFDKNTNEVLKLLQKETYIQIYYYDKSERNSNRISLRAEYITDPRIEAEEQIKIEALEQAKKEAEERAIIEIQNEKKARKEAEAELKVKNNKINDLEDENNVLNEELNQLKNENNILGEELDRLKKENSELIRNIKEYQNKIEENEQELVNTSSNFKIFINIVFSLIFISVVIISFLTIKNKSIFGFKIFNRSDSKSSTEKPKTKKIIEVSETKEVNKTQVREQELARSSYITKVKDSLTEEIKSEVIEDVIEQKSILIDDTKNLVTKESGSEKISTADNKEKLRTTDNSKFSNDSNRHKKNRNNLESIDDKEQIFLDNYYIALVNPNSVAKFEKDYGVFGVDRVSPVSQKNDIEFNKSKLSLIKAQFWATDKIKDQLIILPSRSLIVRSSEMLEDSGRFGYKILNGVYRFKKSDKNKIISMCNCKYLDKKIIVIDEGDLELKS